VRDRLARLVIAVVLLLAFIGDLRVLAPVTAGLLALAAWRHVVLPRLFSVIGALALLGATVAFETDHEVQAWSIVLAVAAIAGASVATATGGSAAGRRVAGSSNRAG
jgi:hypothetical protein